MADDLELKGIPLGVLAVLKARAKEQGRSVEDEAKAILEQALAEGAVPPIRLMAAATPAAQPGDDDS